MNEKNIEKKNNKENKKLCCQHKLNWENALVNSIEKGLFTDPNKGLVNTPFSELLK